jgi:hypothetical protein
MSRGKPQLEKRAAMQRMIETGYLFEQIAQELGYLNARSAKVMAHRWGLNTLHPNSLWYRATGQPKISDPYRP